MFSSGTSLNYCEVNRGLTDAGWDDFVIQEGTLPEKVEISYGRNILRVDKAKEVRLLE